MAACRHPQERSDVAPDEDRQHLLSPGVVGDLPVDRGNAIIVDGDRAAAWADALTEVAHERAFSAALGQAAARSVASRWTIAHAADAMLAGLRLAVTVRVGANGS